MGRGLAWLALLLVATLAGADARAQGVRGGRGLRTFVGRTWLEPYQNYGALGFQPYNARPAIEKHYDPLGNFLAEGTLQWTWVELRPGRGAGNRNPNDGSLQERQPTWECWFNWMSVSSDARRGWAWNLTVSQAIRAKFTSFTLQLPRFTGVAFDVASPKNALTFLYTRGWPTWRQNIEDLPPGPIAGPIVLSRVAVSPIPLFGFHWQTGIGDAVKPGATFVNLHAESATSREFIAQVRGGLPYAMLPPERIIVTFSDDSPEDGTAGAAVFGEPVVRVIAEGDSVLLRFIPSILGGVRVGDHWEANGFDELSFAYEMPLDPIPVAMEIEVTVANDYQIATSQQHRFFNPLTRQVDQDGNPVLFEDRGNDPTVVDRAEGNVRDLSNKRSVRLRYGFNTGTTRYGLDVEADFRGLRLSGEVALSSTYQQFPTRHGDRLPPLRGSAWFLNVTKAAWRSALERRPIRVAELRADGNRDAAGAPC